jgi:hypothetical protein
MKMMKFPKTALWLCGLALLTQRAATQQAEPDRLPLDWVTLPEDQPLALQENSLSLIRGRSATSATPAPEAQPAPGVSEAFASTLAATDAAMVGIRPEANVPAQPGKPKPENWVPWRLAYFTTDLGVSTSGLMGILTLRGNPAVETFWRYQNAKAAPSALELAPAMHREAPSDGGHPVTLHSNMSVQDVREELEPAVRLAMASGRLRDGPVFRRNFESTVRKIHELTEALAIDNGSEWWVSGCRLDMAISADGTFVTGWTAGGELRLRLEWRRLQREGAPSVAGHVPASGLGRQLHDIAITMMEDLEALPEDTLLGSGYSAFSFRQIFGVTMNGTIGLVSVGGNALGSLVYSRRAKRPTLNPVPVAPAAAAPRAATLASLPLIVENPTVSQLNFIRSENLPFLRHGQGNGGTVSLSRERLRKGLTKAAKIGAFFAKHGTKPGQSGWKVYSIRTAYTLSLSGGFALVNVGGQSTFSMQFYNEEF